MKVLVITYLPWRDDISVGNTLTNIFSGLETKIEFANIYFRDGMPNNNIAEKYFHISEKELAKSILTKKVVGQEVKNYKPNNNKEHFSKSYNNARRLRWDIFLLLQDCIGLFGKWKSKELDKFVSEFDPDIIFGPLGRMPASNNLMVHLNKEYNIPIIPYAWDDHYSLKKISFSPFFWIKTFIERKSVKKCAVQSKFLYTITEKMKDEYSSHFKKECKLLFKGYDFIKKPRLGSRSKPVKIIYMGNIGSGRWKVLAKVASSLKKLNKITKEAELFIYTLSPLSSKMKSQLAIEETSYLMEPVVSEEVLATMQSADILIHVEPTKLKDRLFFRLSFSTKLVDYFYNAKCILALGGSTESMNYLQKNDAAIVELKTDNIENKLKGIINNTGLIDQYSNKSWECGVKNHQIKNIQERILNDFKEIIYNHSK